MNRVLFYFFILCFYTISFREQNLIKFDVVKTEILLERTLSLKHEVTVSRDLKFQDNVRNYISYDIEKTGIYRQILRNRDFISNSRNITITQFGFAYNDWRNYINLLSVISLCAIFMLLLSVIFI